MTRISVIVGTTRPGRFSIKVANWILEQIEKQDGVDAKLLDLADFPMPFFEEAIPPSMPGRPPYENEVVKRWTGEIAASDGFVFVTGEYNHGYPAVLKNAIDYVYPEWNRKAAAFVSYGSVGGGRAVEQLRQVAAEVQMATARNAVHLPVGVLMAHFQGGDIGPGLAEQEAAAETMIGELLWWTNALKKARQEDASQVRTTAA